MRYSIALFSIILIAAFSSCKQKQTQTADDSEKSEAAIAFKPADFNVDTAYFFVNEQVKFGPRVTNSIAHAKCAAWLEKTFSRLQPKHMMEPR